MKAFQRDRDSPSDHQLHSDDINSSSSKNNSNITKMSYGDKSSHGQITRFITIRPLCYSVIVIAATTIDVITLVIYSC